MLGERGIITTYRSGVRGIITTYRNGVDLEVEWKIEHFFTLSARDASLCISPEFPFRGERWELWICPNGFRGRDSSGPGHVDLLLWKWSFGPSIKQSFSLSLKTAEGEKYNEQHFLKDFNNYNRAHRFNKFIPRSELSRRRSELVPEGTLTVICTMKSSTSALNDKEEASNAEVTKSDVAESSSSSQAGTTTTKDSVLKWIKENCKEASKGKKRKLEEENVLKWIEENCKEASKGKKRKMEEENSDGSLCQDFKKLLVEGLNNDLILKVGGKELRAHRKFLRARSQVFKSMLGHDMKEKNSGIIDIPDCDPLAMEQFLFYIYSGNVETLDQSNMLNLYYIANKYDMKGLKKECSDFIMESLSQANICDVIQLALSHSDSSLLESTTVYFRNNMLGILHTVEWQVFMKENSTVANELLIKAVEKLSNVKS